MLETVEASGLICGYRMGPEGLAEDLRWDDMDAALDQADTHVWLHFSQSDVRTRAWIADSRRIPDAAKAILLGADTRMRIEATGNGLAGVVGDLHSEFGERTQELEVLRLYLDNGCLISVRRQPLAAVDALRRSMQDGAAAEKPVGLLTQFFHHVTDKLGDLIVELSETIDGLEDDLLGGKLDNQHGEISRIRRVAARLRRHMVPQQHALIGLISRLPDWIGEKEATNLRAAIERLGALGHDLDLVQERARLLQDQLSSRLMEATNRNLYVLSIVTTIFLPMTLISGIFGMNLGGLPALQDPLGFWYGIAIMVVTGLITLWVLRRRKML
ncbi:transporter [Lichenihabitans psoromatis]|uniref:transporter n=1 Tax=Lichenihabitans psoromatis TaxID=2528642 RepID=UPI0010384365|nr:transporter [Lichenihabitans psoromatis]